MAKAATADRVALLFSGERRRVHEIVTPEGVALRVALATRSERVSAFLLDVLIWFLALILIYVGLVYAVMHGIADEVGVTLALFLAFLVRLLYFIEFELAWRGRTPGKQIIGLRVIDRAGGPLTASAIVARNLVREVEIFLPLGLFISLAVTRGTETWQQLSTFGWVFAVSLVPLFNKDHLRVGDIIAGTIVIAMPKRVLAADLAESGRRFVFTPQQLRAYGAFELQVLEEVLRQAPSRARGKLMGEIVEKIRRRISWNDPIPADLNERFLRDFYTAERADLEREQLFGRARLDKEG